MSIFDMLLPKSCAKTNFLATSPYTGLAVLYVDVIIFAMRRLSHDERRSNNKKYFVWGVHNFLGCTFFLGLKYIFFQKNSGDCHGSVEVSDTLFKALQTSVGAQ